jgi:putative transposase
MNGAPIVLLLHAPFIATLFYAMSGIMDYALSMPDGLRRFQHEGHDHFITFSCYDRRPYLGSDHSRILFEQTLETIRARHDFFVFGYVLMPEHVHLLLSEPKHQSRANTMRVLKGETSKLLKQDREQFWQPRYYDFNVLTQHKFVEKLRYMHRNPVARRLVLKPEDWPWSSFCHWLSGYEGRVEIESHWTFDRRERASSHLRQP